mgnify:CR=1 FL=1
MAKKENGNATKSFILRVDAEMMEAIEAWAADEFGVQTARYNTFWIKPYARQGASKETNTKI